MTRCTYCRRPICALVALALTAAVVGCGGDGVARYDVHGTVIYNGQPLPAGTIVFEPDSSKGNKGPQGFAEIRNGEYDTSRSGKGVVQGPQIARVTGYDGHAATEESPMGTPLFPEYTTSFDVQEGSSELNVDIPATGEAQ